MKQIEKYFQAEQSESLLFLLVGLIAILVAIYFLVKQKESFYYGMAYSLIAIALIQITVGASVYLRSPKDIVRVTEMVQSEKTKIQTEEIPRMETVMKNFKIYRWVEISLIAIGIALFFYFQSKPLLRGVGLGLFIQAGFMLLLDFFAESRGVTYLEYLKNIG